MSAFFSFLNHLFILGCASLVRVFHASQLTAIHTVDMYSSTVKVVDLHRCMVHFLHTRSCTRRLYCGFKEHTQ